MFLEHSQKLSGLQQNLVKELREKGIAITTLSELFPTEPVLERLQTWERTHPPVLNTADKKKFLREYWDLIPALDFENPFLSLSLDDCVVDVVETYLGMWGRLKQYHLGKTLPATDRPPVQSQNWHRDPEEKRLCKVFIYLTDVDDTAGPFTYLTQSTYGHRYGRLFPQKTPMGSYPPAEEVAAQTNPADIRSCTGKAGTVIFCDTSGLHFGGRATEKERVMFTAAYSSAWYSEGARYLVTRPEKLAEFPEKQRFLLSGKTLSATPRMN